MSSDSEESHSSAHNDQGDEINTGEGAMSAFSMHEDDVDGSADEQRSLDEERGEHAQSVHDGTGSLTFARTRRRSPQQETQDSASLLSIRPTIEVADSPASTDIPDDTPSVQVCSIWRRLGDPLTKTGFGHILTHEQRTRVAQFASTSPTDIITAIRASLLVASISVAVIIPARPVAGILIAALATDFRVEQSGLPTTVR
jgi:hypothetical protein